MPKKYDRFIGSVFGMQNSGKTTLVQTSILPYCPKPVFIIDPMNEYNAGLLFFDMNNLRNQIVKHNRNASGIYVLKSDNDRDSNLFFSFLARLKLHCTVIIEEADKWAGSHSINEDIFRMINYGAHWGTNLIFVARRPARINNDIIGNSNFIISLKQTESNDIRNLKKSYDSADDLPDLGKYDYIVMGDLPDSFNHLL